MKNSNIKILLVIWSILLTINVKSQPQEPPATLREARRQYMNDKLALTEEEKQKFWPVADELMRKERELRVQYALKMEFIPENLNDKDAEEYLHAITKYHQDEYELQKQYFEKIKQILGSKKTAKFYALRESFKKSMIKQVSGPGSPPPNQAKRKQMPPPPPPVQE